MPVCPICDKVLDMHRQREGLYYSCATCGGRALTIPQLRRVAGDRMGAKFVRLLELNRAKNARRCPFCRHAMSNVALADPALTAEGCRPCSAVWFDAPSYELLPQGVGESTNAMALLSTEIFAELKLKELKDREERVAAERKKRGKRIRDL
jgi:Zn-finger nucleic acid-binding protein